MVIGDRQRIIFCKKNTKALQELITKIDGQHSRVVVDDEADYANAKFELVALVRSRFASGPRSHHLWYPFAPARQAA